MIKLGSAQVRTIYMLLRNNEGLMLAADRDVNDDGMPTIFFDALADMPPGPVALALRLNTPLIPAYTSRRPDNTSVVLVDPPIELTRTGDREKDLKINMRKVAQVLEELILRDPTQWGVLQRIWDKDYTGIEATAAHANAEPQETQEQLPESIPSASINVTIPQPESANPPGLHEEIRGKKVEVRS
jgi:KDO2-lipid IV(A) lauroyltransferase